MSLFRIMAIDFGDARIGLALSDPMRVLAQPFRVLDNRGEETLVEIINITRQRQVGELVVGLPVNTAGADSSKTVQVREFIKALKMRTTIPVKPWDERFTTCEAGEELKKLGLNSRTSKKFIDMMAATLILRSYLESL